MATPYTTLFLDSQVVEVERRKPPSKFHGGRQERRTWWTASMQYQPGHINASQSETKAADGKSWRWAASFKDRFLPVGPLHLENEQLIDISGEKMVLLADHPVRGEPHDFIIFKRELVRPKQVYDLDEFRWPSRTPRSPACSAQWQKGHREDDFRRPRIQPARVVQEGDEVTLILTNLDKIEDLTHGFGDPEVQRELHDQPAGDQVGDLHGRQAWRVLVLLHAPSATRCTWRCVLRSSNCRAP